LEVKKNSAIIIVETATIILPANTFRKQYINSDTYQDHSSSLSPVVILNEVKDLDFQKPRFFIALPKMAKTDFLRSHQLFSALTYFLSKLLSFLIRKNLSSLCQKILMVNPIATTAARMPCKMALPAPGSR